MSFPDERKSIANRSIALIDGSIALTAGPRDMLARWTSRTLDGARRASTRLRPIQQVVRTAVRVPTIAWHHRDSLTLPVRWPLLRNLDRPLAFLLRLEPRLLSSRVSVARVPFQGTVPERIKLLLWEMHSVGMGIILSVVIGAGMCVVALAASHLCTIPMLGLKDDVDGIPTMIIATAAYLGGVFGFLQAVTIFAVQLRSQQDTSMLPLTPLIARRYFTFLILGAIAGVTIANLLAALAAPLLPVGRSAFGALSWLNLLAVPGATVGAFWYLAKIVSEAGEADMDVALPVLRATMRAQTLADARQIALLNEYGRCLDLAGIKYDLFAGSSFRATSSLTARIPFGGPGIAFDMDCHRLSKVARMLRTVTPSPLASVNVAIGQSLRSDNALILAWESPASPGTDAPPAPTISDEDRKRLVSALKGVFLLRREPVK